MEHYIATILIYAVPAILAITLHEAAHGYVARMFGDNTAWMLGRVTLNPIKHIDPVGTLVVPGVLLLGSLVSGTGGLLFGWAKPVPVNFSRLRQPKSDMIWVSLAGPASNLVQALLWAIALKLWFILLPATGADQFVYELARAGILVNLMLMAFNLLPILPLDGGRVLAGLLPYNLAWKYSRLEPYGMIVIIVLLMSGLLNYFIRPFMMFGQSVIGLVL